VATCVQSSRKRPGRFEPLHGRARGCFIEAASFISNRDTIKWR
jgi:hypothetical protein